MMGTPPGTEPSSDSAPQSCPLEALNVDCILAVLSEVSSLADLSAFIRASPAVLECFLSAKASILLRVLTHELGPAVRDALVLSQTYNLDMFAAGTFEQTLDIAVGGYRECLLAETEPWVPAQDVETAVDMARLTRDVLFFADLYIRRQAQRFGHALDSPRDEWRISRTERRRIAQSLLRFQVIAGFYHPALDDQDRADYFFSRVIKLFKSWELEQISHMADFVSNLVQFFEPWDKHRPCDPGNQYYDICRYYHTKYFFNLAEFCTRVVEAQKRDDTFLSRLTTCNSRGSASRIACLAMSHRWVQGRGSTAAAPLLALLDQAPEDAAARVDFNGDSPISPPWAWVHAWDGRLVNRWGWDLVPNYSHAGGDREEQVRMDNLMRSSRLLGLVFWDKDRVDEVLRDKALEGCRRGWLWLFLTSGPGATGAAPLG